MITATEWMYLRKIHDRDGNNASLLHPHDQKILDEGTWIRAGGECICETCGLEYWRHNPVVGALWLLRLCGGKLIKT